MSSKSEKTYVWYAAYCRLPSEKAHSVYVMKHCESLAAAGAEVTLLVPRRAGRERKDPFVYYGVESNFTIVYLPIIELFRLPFARSITYRIDLFCFSWIAAFYARLHAPRHTYYCSNEFLCAWAGRRFFSRVVLELHDYLDMKRHIYARTVARFSYVLVQTKWKRDQVMQDFGVLPERVLYVPNGVDPERFAFKKDKRVLRARLGLPAQGQLCVYTGHLYGWKGVDTLVAAAKYLPDVTIVLVGGLPKDVERYKRMCASMQNVQVLGHRPHTEIPLFQGVADVLVLPNTAHEDISTRYTSPMKLFEYMASGRPIVASDIPSLREILNDRNAYLICPDDPEALARGIREAIQDQLPYSRGAQAQQDVQQYAWSKRAAQVLKFLQSNA